MNVRIPHQGDQSKIGFEKIEGVQSPFWYFIMVICFMLFFATIVVTLTRYLRWRARRDLDIKRGHPPVDAWDAYWGWK
jgi:heme/copper-type cytochrome/quinol oxidase subunit 2